MTKDPELPPQPQPGNGDDSTDAELDSRSAEDDETRSLLFEEAENLGLGLPAGSSTADIETAIIRHKQQQQLPDMIRDLNLRPDTRDWDDAMAQIREREQQEFGRMPRPNSTGLGALYDYLKGAPPPDDKPEE